MPDTANARPRTRQQIESDLTAARSRLAANLESLIDEVHPTNVKQRQVAAIKTVATTEFNNAKSQFQTEDGKWRKDRLALIGGAVVGAVVLLVGVRLLTAKRS